MTELYKLYGMTASLYTGKVRAYMRFNQVPFVEEKAGSDRFSTVIRKAVGRWIVPVIETPEGAFIQDGSNILDYFEQNGFSKRSIYPDDPRLRAIAHLFELFGSEGLLRPAMHYRWNFDETNLDFLKVSFEDIFRDGLDAEEQEATFLKSSGAMRSATLFFGAVPEVEGTVETSYAEFLSLLSAHLKEMPFLLGGYPTVGDYGLFGPLWAHLGRDPKPLHLMQTTAPRVHRWTERMNMSERYIDETTVKAGPGLMSGDQVPDTLKALMRFIAEDYLPEITAHIAYTNKWLADNPNPSETHNPKIRTIGMASFDWRGHTIKSAVMPYRCYLLQRLHDTFEAMSADQQAELRNLFSETGLESLLDLRATRRVVRKDHLEVWE